MKTGNEQVNMSVEKRIEKKISIQRKMTASENKRQVWERRSFEGDEGGGWMRRTVTAGRRVVVVYMLKNIDTSWKK